MKIFYSLIFTFFFTSFSFGQNYLDGTSEWREIQGDAIDEWYRTTHYEMYGDTLIDGKIYHKIINHFTIFYCSVVPCSISEGDYLMLLREEDKRFYEWTPNGDKFIIDFDLEVGDSILIPGWWPNVVTEIDSFQFNNETRKIFKTLYQLEIYEGIGSSYGLFEGYGLNGDERFGILKCYSQNGEAVALGEYDAPFWELEEAIGNCEGYTNAKHEISNDLDLILYPNPTFEKLSVLKNKIFNADIIRLFHINGREYSFKIISETPNKIELAFDQNLPIGMYFLLIKENDQIITKKFVRQ